MLGTANGEELALGEEEKIETVRTVHGAHAGRRFIVAGIDTPSVAQTVRLSDRYAEAGADLVRVRVPRDMAATSVEAYFKEVTEHAARPVIVIHQTFSTGPAASPRVLGAICQLDNVFGYITDHDIRFEGGVRPNVPADRRFWICNGGLLLYGMLLGANGACMWLGNVAPALCMDIVRLGYEERFAEARRLQATASRIDSVVGQHGVAGVKTALGLLGYEGTRPRAPTPAVAEDQRARIEAVLREAGLL